MHNSEKSNVAHGLRSLFVKELKDIYWAEQALSRALPKMAKKATYGELVEAINGHLEETKGHTAKLEEVFSLMGEKPVAEKCEAMSGLLEEAEEIMEETEEGMVRDAGIILAAQKVEHYEIASYGTLCAFAKTLGEPKVDTLLQQILTQEKAADAKLSQIAEAFINEEAMMAE